MQAQFHSGEMPEDLYRSRNSKLLNNRGLYASNQLRQTIKKAETLMKMMEMSSISGSGET
jgi:hypothetical protein